MPRWLFTVLIFLFVLTIVELYAFQALKTFSSNKIIRVLWVGLSVLAYGYFFFTVFNEGRSNGQTIKFQWAMAVLLLTFLPKVLMIVVLFGEDVFRYFKKMLQFFSGNSNVTIDGRRKFISQIALGAAAIPFLSMLYGIIRGKYNYKVLKYELTFKDLPEAFDGFTISHITDIHSGSFDNKEKIQYGVDLINEQQSDVILFTGDIVNNFAHEMDNWIPVFSQLKAKEGKFSILGNHDYGEYSEWKSSEEKENNFNAIKDIHPKIGFDLLLNEHRYLEKNGQKIALVGVENWGKGFKQKGDLEKASSEIKKDDFKILLSHDPSHWEEMVKKDDFNYQLTLSGHTHGLQFGIEIPGFIKWSPAKYVYKQWAGLYEEFGRYINVNRGFGYHAFPGRVGIWPEISVIKLKKA